MIFTNLVDVLSPLRFTAPQRRQYSTALWNVGLIESSSFNRTTMLNQTALLLLTILLVLTSHAQKRPLPVIDMHLHALHANDQGPAPISVGAPFRDLGINDPKND